MLPENRSDVVVPRRVRKRLWRVAVTVNRGWARPIREEQANNMQVAVRSSKVQRGTAFNARDEVACLAARRVDVGTVGKEQLKHNNIPCCCSNV